MLTRRSALKWLSGLAGAKWLSGLGDVSWAAGAATADPKATPAKRPNIVCVLGEGLRADEFSLMGNPILKTPHMDRIGTEGCVFNNAFVINALCLPARATIMTGLYSHTTGAVSNVQGDLPGKVAVVSDLLFEAGYETAFIGKSHIHGALLDRHWDYYFGFPGQGDYYRPIITEGAHGKYEKPRLYEGQYIDDLLTDRAVAWLEQEHDRPFVLFLWFYAPHAPFYRPKDLVNMYNGVPIPVPSTFNEDQSDYAGKPRAVADADNKIGSTELHDDCPRSLEELVKDHYVGVMDNDRNVGRVVAELERQRALDDTAILLSSDHGFLLGEHHFYDKRLMYEPSIRIPMMLRYPKRIPAGTRPNKMALNLDIAPTMLDIAGVAIPQVMQGHSLMPLAAGREDTPWRKDWLYEYYEYPGYENVKPCRGVRTERYKYIHYFLAPEEFELYDLASDPEEKNNLYGKPAYAALASQLATRLDELRRETGDHFQYRPTGLPMHDEVNNN
ncbi:sulfatase [Dyella flava]|uniref:Sulfatase n=1 Tax=Dyella flava TaxID=1920170 RepID=A0ABS2K2B8_9GAMM|nr:sulfatase [Dyella flava]MBM7125366.1 sulfatase [Dyella flava]GLQ51774.1 acetylglucosamine-6-sulfatase [Dyella flava]